VELRGARILFAWFGMDLLPEGNDRLTALRELKL
jgi:hypothetical protein